MAPQLRTKKIGNLPTHAHRRAPNQEKEVAKRVGGKLTPRSGAGTMKGDVRVKGVSRIECKTTSHRSFSVTREMVEKIENAALAGGGELPAIVVEFLGQTGKPECSVAVVPLYVLDILGVRDAS